MVRLATNPPAAGPGVGVVSRRRPQTWIAPYDNS